MAEDPIPDIVLAIVEKQTYGEWLVLPHKRLKIVSTSHRDEGADTTKHSLEQVGALPCHIERGNTTTAEPENHMVGTIFRESHTASVGKGDTLDKRQ